MALVTQNRADPDLVELLVTKSFDSLDWMRNKGVRLIPIYGRQAYKVDGKFKFWGGLALHIWGGGPESPPGTGDSVSGEPNPSNHYGVSPNGRHAKNPTSASP